MHYNLKNAFNFYLSDSLQTVVRRSVDCNESEMESAVQTYLNCAPDHVGGGGRK